MEEKPLKVVVRYVPCDSEEWEDALDLLAGIIAEACLDGQMERDYGFEAREEPGRMYGMDGAGRKLEYLEPEGERRYQQRKDWPKKASGYRESEGEKD